ncbi:hypothetical protein [Vibrio owensii]|uniref:hypothetical protein n=1 Tax=Vibrio harveyi group TaxID=717610 RepID=UPI003CC69922
MIIQNFDVTSSKPLILCQVNVVGFPGNSIVGYLTQEPIYLPFSEIKRYFEKYLPEVPSSLIEGSMPNDMVKITEKFIGSVCRECETSDFKAKPVYDGSTIEVYFSNLNLDMCLGNPMLEDNMNRFYSTLRQKAFELVKQYHPDLTENELSVFKHEIDEEYEGYRGVRILCELTNGNPELIRRFATLYNFIPLDDDSLKVSRDALDKTVKLLNHKTPENIECGVVGNLLAISCENDVQLTNQEEYPALEKINEVKDMLYATLQRLEKKVDCELGYY